MLIPTSAVVATRNRSQALRIMLASMANQSAQPQEMIVIDGSENDTTKEICHGQIPNLKTKIIYHRATAIGAAIQRNQGMEYATQNTIWLLDDDIIFEPNCVEKLWQALNSNPQLGGVNAMITNQKYLTPGRISKYLFRLLHGRWESSYAGKCIGPALNLLPEDNPDLPEVVPVEWLNTTCVMYRREALPSLLFPPIFTGYSLMEDVTLSLTVGKQWELANVRTARIFHDSQPGDHKNDRRIVAKMELVNRHYVMTQVLERRALKDYSKLLILQLFHLAACLASDWKSLPQVILGKLKAIPEIISMSYQTIGSKL